MSSPPEGMIVRVFGDLVLVGVDDDSLREFGKRGKYVKIVTKTGEELIGIVSNINLTDELYRQSGGRLELIRGYEELTLVRNEVIVSILGTLTSDGVDRRILSTPTPGDRVYPLDDEKLSEIFSNGDIEIGVLNTQRGVRVTLDLNELATKHLAILAMTGSGKSNALGIIILNLLEKFTYPRILLIDTHSEYIPLKFIDGYEDRVRIYAPRGRLRDALIDIGIDVEDLEIPYWLLNIDEWYSLIGLDARATKQRRIFRAALRSVKENELPGSRLNDPIYFEIGHLLNMLERMRDSDEVLMKLEDALDNEDYDFIFTPSNALQLKDDPKKMFFLITKPVLSNGLNIISLGGLSSEVQNVVTSMLLRWLFRISIEAKLKRMPIPMMIAVEEAHVYAPEYFTPAKYILEKIAKEGRKFGIGLIVVSQRPRELSQTLLAQCGTLIALRTVNPSDQAHIQRSMEDVTQMVLSSLPSLGKGEAVISGPAIPIPGIVKIHHFDEQAERICNRKVSLGGKDVDFKTLWMESLNEEALDEILRDIYTVSRESRESFEEEKRGTLDKFFGE